MRQAAAAPPSGPDRWNIQPPPTGSMEHRAGPGRARHETSGTHDAYGTPETATVRNPPEKSRAHAADSWLGPPQGHIVVAGSPQGHIVVAGATAGSRRGGYPEPVPCVRPLYSPDTRILF